MYYLKCILFFGTFFKNVKAYEDLEPLFSKKHCIEASLISVTPAENAAIMIDKNSITHEPTLINVSEIIKTQYEKSAISKINELAQYNEIEASFELISEEGPAHAKNFKVTLTLGDETYVASGSSIKNAKKAAAILALENTYYEHPPVNLKSTEENNQSLTPTVVLNNIAMTLGIAVSYTLVNSNEEQAIESYGSYEESYGKSKSYFPKLNSSTSVRVPTEEAQISGPFTVKVKVADSVFVGIGHTIQAARHDAATKAMKSMEKQVLFRDNVCTSEESVGECKQRKENLKSPVSRVYEAAQNRNLPVEFNLQSESGKSHQKVFVTQCILGEFVTEGEGKSKKESKRIAAEKMLENFSLLPEISDDGKNIINGLKKKKKKKNKIKRKNVEYFGQGVSDILNSFWSTKDQDTPKGSQPNKKATKSKPTNDNFSPKDKLLEVANLLNIQIQFNDLNKRGDEFFTLMSLGVHPLHVCLGKALSRDKAQDKAAIHGLKFLHRLGVLDKAGLTEEKSGSYNFDDIMEDEIPLSFEETDS